MKKSILVFAIVVGMVVMAGPAKAAVITFTLDTVVEGVYGGSSPYGTIQLVDNGNNIDFTVSLNDVSFTVGVISLNYSGTLGLAASWSASGGNIGANTIAVGSNSVGFNGWFDIRLVDSGPYSNPLMFTLSKSSTDLNASDFNIKDENGVYYAVVRVAGAEGTKPFFGAKTSQVPEPSTLLLLGSGLIGLVGFGRKRFKK